MCYQEPCVKCLHCGKCVVACANKMDKEMQRTGERQYIFSAGGTYNITFNDAGLPPGTTVSIDPLVYAEMVEFASQFTSKPEMTDDDAFNLMDSIRKERPWQALQGDDSA